MCHEVMCKYCTTAAGGLCMCVLTLLLAPYLSCGWSCTQQVTLSFWDSQSSAHSLKALLQACQVFPEAQSVVLPLTTSCLLKSLSLTPEALYICFTSEGPAAMALCRRPRKDVWSSCVQGFQTPSFLGTIPRASRMPSQNCQSSLHSNRLL